MRKHYEWNVYIDGKYCGTVQARDEEEARCNAIVKYEPNENARISVQKR